MTGFDPSDNSRSKPKGVHHANIRNQARSAKRLKTAFRKVGIQFTLDQNNRLVNGEIVLSEITTRSAFIFVKEKLGKGNMLTLHLKEPLSIDVRGKVRYCEVADRNATIRKSSNKNLFRMLVEFMLASQSESEAMEDYYQQVRDDSYVATKWHHYISEKAQREARSKVQELQMAEKVKEAQDQPELATEDMLVAKKDEDSGNEAA